MKKIIMILMTVLSLSSFGYTIKEVLPAWEALDIPLSGNLIGVDGKTYKINGNSIRGIIAPKDEEWNVAVILLGYNNNGEMIVRYANSNGNYIDTPVWTATNGRIYTASSVRKRRSNRVYGYEDSTHPTDGHIDIEGVCVICHEGYEY